LKCKRLHNPIDEV
jgi:phage-related protein